MTKDRCDITSIITEKISVCENTYLLYNSKLLQDRANFKIDTIVSKLYYVVSYMFFPVSHPQMKFRMAIFLY